MNSPYLVPWLNSILLKEEKLAAHSGAVNIEKKYMKIEKDRMRL